MGQAQSQFSSGDCSGCGGVGGVSYPEYTSGSPDPLRLDGGGVPTYQDGKPSSILGLPGTAGGAYGPGFGGISGQVGQPGGFGPGSGAGGFAPGTAGAGPSGVSGQVGRPGVGDVYGPGTAGLPGTGQIGAPGNKYGQYKIKALFISIHYFKF